MTDFPVEEEMSEPPTPEERGGVDSVKVVRIDSSVGFDADVDPETAVPQIGLRVYLERNDGTPAGPYYLNLALEEAVSAVSVTMRAVEQAMDPEFVAAARKQVADGRP